MTGVRGVVVMRSSRQTVNKETEQDMYGNQASRSISQVIVYNTVVNQTKKPLDTGMPSET